METVVGGEPVMQTDTLTYSQNWPAYNKSQEEEKARFMALLSNLLAEIEEPVYVFGRPRISQSNMLFASALKVYIQFSLRRFVSDMQMAKDRGYLSYSPCFASVGHFMQRKDITKVLHRLIDLSSIPLRSVETKFAIYGTGFHTTSFGQYLYTKHKTGQHHRWINVFACCGVKTNIITAVEVTTKFSTDAPHFLPLAKRTHENGFKIEEMTADKAYLSKHHLRYIAEIGGVSFIPFKSNSVAVARSDKVWKKMYHYFMPNREQFMEHYHLRSNIEATFHMIKMKFNDGIKSKSRTAQVNETLLKILCHNIVVLIHEMNELGIEPDFFRGGV